MARSSWARFLGWDDHPRHDRRWHESRFRKFNPGRPEAQSHLPNPQPSAVHMSYFSSHVFGLTSKLRRCEVLPSYATQSLESAIPAPEVTRIALRLRRLVEECVPCELEESQITRSHSRIITKKVIQAAREAGGEDNRGCVVMAFPLFFFVCLKTFPLLLILFLLHAKTGTMSGFLSFGK